MAETTLSDKGSEEATFTALPKESQHLAMAIMIVGRDTKRLLELEKVESLRKTAQSLCSQEELLRSGMFCSHSGWYETDQMAIQSEEEYAQALAEILFCLEKTEYIQMNQISHFRVAVVTNDDSRIIIHLNFCGSQGGVLGDTNASLKSKALKGFGKGFSHKDKENWTLTESTGRINIKYALGSQLARLGSDAEDIVFTLIPVTP